MPLLDEDTFSTTQLLPYKGPFDPYRCSDRDVEELFLFSERRKVLWLNFLQWRNEMKQVFGETIFWINGSFVTIKTDPSDVDVVAIVRREAFLNANERDQSKCLSLKTIPQKNPDGSTTRIQPYGGLIDSFIVPCDNIDMSDATLRFWDAWWSKVNTEKGYLHTTRQQKGYLEVR